jgi:CBS-domain-containing membrane protein
MKRVKDVMTRPVVVIHESMTFKASVGLMRKHGVSALPVVDDADHLVGVVSEDDVLVKEERAAVGGSRRVFHGRSRRADRAKARGAVARDLMTRNVVTVEAEATIARAARVMDEERIKRLPVVDESGKVLGIVTRADLLRIFLRLDHEIAVDVERALTGPTGWVEPGRIRVTVVDGVAQLEGRAERRSQIPILVGIAQAVDGVVDVEGRLTYDLDDVTWDKGSSRPGGCTGPRRLMAEGIFVTGIRAARGGRHAPQGIVPARLRASAAPVAPLGSPAEQGASSTRPPATRSSPEPEAPREDR